MKWPENPKTLEAAYPTTGIFDVRIMGGASVPLATLESSVTPPAWLVYPTDAMAVPDFLETLDFYVFFQHSVATEAFGRSILEAIASGLVVILPPHYEEVFHSAALYCEASAVQDLVMEYHVDRLKYEHQVRRARVVLQDLFSHSSYASRIGQIISTRQAL